MPRDAVPTWAAQSGQATTLGLLSNNIETRGGFGAQRGAEANHTE
jgi:hypothetical protein